MRVPLLLITLLISIVLASFLIQHTLETSSVVLDQHLESIGKLLIAKKTVEAGSAFAKFRKSWRGVQTRWTLFTDHREIDEIEMALVRLESGLAQEETAMALAELATIRRLVKHIPLKEKLTLENIL